MEPLAPLDRAVRAARRGQHDAARRLLDEVLAGDPHDEVALVWRARVAGDPAAAAPFLRRAVELNPDNRWAAEQLGTGGGATGGPPPLAPALSVAPPPLGGASQAAPPPLPGMAAGPAVLHHLQCPRCGGSVEVHPERGAKAVVCKYCGSLLDLTTAQAEILGQVDPKVGPDQPIEPGMEGKFQGERHLVIGWLRYKGWDDEDTWTWDEWQLVSDGGTARYLSYSADEGFTLQTPVRPRAPFSPSSGAIEVPGGSAAVRERGPAQIIAIRGELTWRPRLDETLVVMEAVGAGGTRYSAEWTGNEVELVGGQALPEADVWRAFGRKDLADRSVVRDGRRKAYGRLARVCFLVALGLGFAGCGACFIGTPLLEQSTTLAGAPAVSFDGSAPEAEPVRVGTFEVTAPGTTHEVSLDADLSGYNPWAEVTTYVTGPDGEQHALATSEFWSESDESDRSDSHLFKPPTAGTYTLALELEDASAPPVTVRASVRGGVWMARYPMIAALLAALLGMLCLRVGNGRP